MNVLIVGSGGREHALAWQLAKSPLVDKLYCAPGNGGIAEIATCVDIDVMDFSGLIGLCRAEEIEFVVVGPEAPLVEGFVDRWKAARDSPRIYAPGTIFRPPPMAGFLTPMRPGPMSCNRVRRLS